jgi:murein DD-endopeptidase MepM/ murein hydrolase activator NlpD
MLKKLVLHKVLHNALRLVLVLCIINFSAVAVPPLVVKLRDYVVNRTQNDDGSGIGGQNYTEMEIAEINEGVVVPEDEISVPEPEEFSTPFTLMYSLYKIQSGDMIGFIAENFGLNQGTLISVNDIKNSRQIYPNENLRIPNQDGIIHNVAAGETLETIAAQYEVDIDAIVTVNELFSQKVNGGTKLFVPGAKLDSAKLQEINGDLFIWPIRGRITSRYGYRISPISGRRSFHTGVDLSGVTGVPIKAAMSGRVVTAGWSDVYGNYIVIAHHSNYRTLYGHMSAFRARSGSYVRTGETIGYVGNTGQSVGSHLHFMVYKNGVTVNPLTLLH